jgi:hypothetical protein
MMEYFRKHDEQAFIGKMLLLLLVLWPMQERLESFLFILPIFFFLYLIAKVVAGEESALSIITRYISFVPMTYDERESVKRNVPYITFLLVASNVLIYYFHPLRDVSSDDYVIQNFIFPPKPI